MSLKSKTEPSSGVITGGTGSFGQRFTQTVLSRPRLDPHKLIIFSRDELKQHEMRQRFPEEKYPAIRYFIGDVRDRERLYRAFDAVDVVVHAAALELLLQQRLDRVPVQSRPPSTTPSRP